MADFVRVNQESVAKLSDGAADVIAHLCETDCLTFADVVSWCESRNDCVHEVRCPKCGTKFMLDDDDVVQLERWTDNHGDALVCGVRSVA